MIQVDLVEINTKYDNLCINHFLFCFILFLNPLCVRNYFSHNNQELEKFEKERKSSRGRELFKCSKIKSTVVSLMGNSQASYNHLNVLCLCRYPFTTLPVSLEPVASMVIAKESTKIWLLALLAWGGGCFLPCTMGAQSLQTITFAIHFSLPSHLLSWL